MVFQKTSEITSEKFSAESTTSLNLKAQVVTPSLAFIVYLYLAKLDPNLINSAQPAWNEKWGDIKKSADFESLAKKFFPFALEPNSYRT